MGCETRRLRLNSNTVFQNLGPKLKDIAIGFSERSSAINAFEHIQKNGLFAVGLFDGTIRLLDAVTGEEAACLSGHTDSITSLFLNSSNTTLASTSLDGRIRIWDINDTSKSVCISAPGSESFTGSFSSDGSRVGIALGSGRVAVWEVGRIEDNAKSLANHDGPMLSASFSPDASMLVTGSTDATIKLWGVYSGGQLRDFRGHNGPVTFVAFSPGMQQIVSQSAQSSANLASEFLRLVSEVKRMGIDSVRLSPPMPSNKSVWVWGIADQKAPQVIPITKDTTPPPIADERQPPPWILHADRRGTAFESKNDHKTIAWYSEPLEMVTYNVAHRVLALNGKLHFSDSVNHLYVLGLECLSESVFYLSNRIIAPPPEVIDVENADFDLISFAAETDDDSDYIILFETDDELNWEVEPDQLPLPSTSIAFDWDSEEINLDAPVTTEHETLTPEAMPQLGMKQLSTALITERRRGKERATSPKNDFLEIIAGVTVALVLLASLGFLLIQTWPKKAEATIVNAHIEKVLVIQRYGSRTEFRIESEFAYYVEGVKYEKKGRLSIIYDEGVALKELQEYKEGKTFTIWYNPGRPEQLTGFPILHWWFAICIPVGIVSVFILHRTERRKVL